MNQRELNRLIDLWLKTDLQNLHDTVKQAWIGPSAKQTDVTKIKALIQKRIEKLK